MSLRDLALSLFIFGCIPFILVRPYYGLLVWAWLGYMNPHRLTWGFAYSFPWVQLIALVTLGALLLTREKRALPWTSFTGLLLSFTVWTGVCTLFAFASDAAWLQFQQFVKIQVMVVVTLLLVINTKQIHWLIWVIAYSIGFYGIKGGIFVLTTGGAYHVFGPSGSFIAGNNALALALCMVLPLMRYLQMQQSRKWIRVCIGIGMGLTILGIVGTYSRGGLIALAAVCAFLLFKSRGKILVAIAVIVVVPIMLSVMPAKWAGRMESIANFQQQGSVISRINSWQFAFNMAVDRPLVGGGFEAYRNESIFWRYAPEGAWKSRAIHSIFFQVLGDQGFVGLALFLALLWTGWRAGSRIRRQTKNNPELKWAYDLASMLQVSLIAYVIGGSAAPLAYFDLAYQLLAIFVLIGLEVEKYQVSTAQKGQENSRRAALSPHQRLN